MTGWRCRLFGTKRGRTLELNPWAARGTAECARCGRGFAFTCTGSFREYYSRVACADDIAGASK